MATVNPRYGGKAVQIYGDQREPVVSEDKTNRSVGEILESFGLSPDYLGPEYRDARTLADVEETEKRHHGIDYGLGMSNIDHTTGIRFGVIPANRVDWWEEMAEDVPETPACPNCGEDLVEWDSDKHDEYVAGETRWHNPDYFPTDYACESCKKTFSTDNEQLWSDERHLWLKNDEYFCYDDSSFDVWVEKSPYYTRAAFCSPCAPGACYLTSTTPYGEKAYCLGPDFFEDQKPPYPVWRVTDDSLVAEGPSDDV